MVNATLFDAIALLRRAASKYEDDEELNEAKAALDKALHFHEPEREPSETEIESAVDGISMVLGLPSIASLRNRIAVVAGLTDEQVEAMLRRPDNLETLAKWADSVAVLEGHLALRGGRHV